MQLQLNLEAPGYSTMQIAQMLHDRLLARTVKVRAESATYDGPDGSVCTTVMIAAVDDPAFNTLGDILNEIALLSRDLHQDCIAVMAGSTGFLAGPHADKWFPFNQKFFKEYKA